MRNAAGRGASARSDVEGGRRDGGRKGALAGAANGFNNPGEGSRGGLAGRQRMPPPPRVESPGSSFEMIFLNLERNRG